MKILVVEDEYHLGEAPSDNSNMQIILMLCPLCQMK
mgnify:CR=1 FL=1